MNSTELAYAGAFDQARLIRNGEVSAVDVVEATLARIGAHNAGLNAYRVVFAEQALDEARAIDGANARDTRPLAGVPVAIKDDADVAGEVTAWGTGAYGSPKERDSDVVTRLRSAGAIIIGKTHVPEMTLWPWTASKTWGVTRNPWDTQRTPGGSSGGSAVAVSTGMCGVALGSDGGGSIRYPSALTGLFGIKPQRDRISLGPDHHDAWNGLSVYGPHVVITPLTPAPAPLIDDVVGHGVVRSFRDAMVVSWIAPWNAIGQPAASVPVGFDAHGLPLAVQLCGRRSDEVTLLQLAAQIERAQPWAHRRPA